MMPVQPSSFTCSRRNGSGNDFADFDDFADLRAFADLSGTVWRAKRHSSTENEYSAAHEFTTSTMHLLIKRSINFIFTDADTDADTDTDANLLFILIDDIIIIWFELKTFFLL
jgi:hypothetical protein